MAILYTNFLLFTTDCLSSNTMERGITLCELLLDTTIDKDISKTNVIKGKPLESSSRFQLISISYPENAFSSSSRHLKIPGAYRFRIHGA